MIDDGIAVADGAIVRRLEPAAYVESIIAFEEPGDELIVPARATRNYQYACPCFDHVDGNLLAVVFQERLPFHGGHRHSVDKAADAVLTALERDRVSASHDQIFRVNEDSSCRVAFSPHSTVLPQGIIAPPQGVIALPQGVIALPQGIIAPPQGVTATGRDSGWAPAEFNADPFPVEPLGQDTSGDRKRILSERRRRPEHRDHADISCTSRISDPDHVDWNVAVAGVTGNLRRRRSLVEAAVGQHHNRCQGSAAQRLDRTANGSFHVGRRTDHRKVGRHIFDRPEALACRGAPSP